MTPECMRTESEQLAAYCAIGLVRHSSQLINYISYYEEKTALRGNNWEILWGKESPRMTSLTHECRQSDRRVNTREREKLSHFAMLSRRSEKRKKGKSERYWEPRNEMMRIMMKLLAYYSKILILLALAWSLIIQTIYMNFEILNHCDTNKLIRRTTY